MNCNVNKLRIYFYLFVVILFVVFLIARVMNMPKEMNEGINFCKNEEVFISPWPPDLVPHIMEIEEEERVRPCQPNPNDNPEEIEYC